MMELIESKIGDLPLSIGEKSALLFLVNSYKITSMNELRYVLGYKPSMLKSVPGVSTKAFRKIVNALDMDDIVNRGLRTERARLREIERYSKAHKQRAAIIAKVIEDHGALLAMWQSILEVAIESHPGKTFGILHKMSHFIRKTVVGDLLELTQAEDQIRSLLEDHRETT